MKELSLDDVFFLACFLFFNLFLIEVAEGVAVKVAIFLYMLCILAAALLVIWMEPKKRL